MGSKLTHIATIRSNQFCDRIDDRHPDFSMSGDIAAVPKESNLQGVLLDFSQHS
jgi:hypothetical protein